MLAGWKWSLDKRLPSRSKIPLTVLKMIGNTLFKSLDEESNICPNKDCNKVVECGGSKYFVVYEFFPEKKIVGLKEAKITR